MPVDMSFPQLSNLHITCDTKVWFIIGVAHDNEAVGPYPKAGFTFGATRDEAISHIPPSELALMRNAICIDMVQHLKDLSVWLMADTIVDNWIDKHKDEK